MYRERVFHSNGCGLIASLILSLCVPVLPDLLSMFMAAEDQSGELLNPNDEFLRDVVMNLYVSLFS